MKLKLKLENIKKYIAYEQKIHLLTFYIVSIKNLKKTVKNKEYEMLYQWQCTATHGKSDSKGTRVVSFGNLWSVTLYSP